MWSVIILCIICIITFIISDNNLFNNRGLISDIWVTETVSYDIVQNSALFLKLSTSEYLMGLAKLQEFWNSRMFRSIHRLLQTGRGRELLMQFSQRVSNNCCFVFKSWMMILYKIMITRISTNQIYWKNNQYMEVLLRQHFVI